LKNKIGKYGYEVNTYLQYFASVFVLQFACFGRFLNVAVGFLKVNSEDTDVKALTSVFFAICRLWSIFGHYSRNIWNHM